MQAGPPFSEASSNSFAVSYSETLYPHALSSSPTADRKDASSSTTWMADEDLFMGENVACWADIGILVPLFRNPVSGPIAPKGNSFSRPFGPRLRL
jgi:hypothetical protein